MVTSYYSDNVTICAFVLDEEPVISQVATEGICNSGPSIGVSNEEPSDCRQRCLDDPNCGGYSSLSGVSTDCDYSCFTFTSCNSTEATPCADTVESYTITRRSGGWDSELTKQGYNDTVTKFDIIDPDSIGSPIVGSMKSYCFEKTECPYYSYDNNQNRNLQSSKSAEVGGIGTSTLQFGGSRRLADDTRNLQDAPVAEIEMSIGVTTLDDGPAALRTAGGATLRTTTALVASIIGLFASVYIL